MPRRLAAVLGLLILAAAGAAGAERVHLPKPPEILPRVGFWKRVYTEVGTDGGFVHDARDLAVVYEVLRFPESLAGRARERRIEARKDHYRAVLRRLAGGKRSGLDADERRVLTLFPEGVSNATLRRAADQVRFQLGQANKFRDGLVRMGRWEGYIRRVLAERGLPEELVAIPHVESSYNPEAHSHAGAAGLWQFTRSTGRMFMRVDDVLDERRDPFLATVAAARLLKQNYEKTGSWPLAITAYNHGAGGMLRAVRQLGTRDIVAILDRYQGRTFGFASRNFYCEFLAALEVETDPERYFGPLRKEPPVDPEIVVLDHYYRADTLAEAFTLPLATLRRENPALLQPIWSGSKHVPRGYALRVPRDPARPAGKVVLASVSDGRRYLEQVRDRHYRVQRGDTLSRIAQRFGVSESELVAANGLRSRHRIRVGQTLKLPVEAGGLETATVAAEPLPTEGLYRVRRGDTLSSIARRYGLSTQDLAATNRLENRNRLVVGQVLELPRGALSARVGSTASTAAGGVHVVRRGDTLQGIARRYRVPEDALVARNRLRDRHVIHPGQRLTIPGGAEAPPPSAADEAAEEPLRVVAEAGDAVAAVTADAPGMPAEAPQDTASAPVAADGGLPASPRDAPPVLPLDADRYRVSPDGSIRAAPEETLGHYAEWLDVAPAALRRANRLGAGALPLGARVELDFSRVSRAAFQERRLEHHRRLQEDFYGSFAVAGTREVVLRRGDTLWKLAQGHGEVPVWLILAYNPDVDASALRPGQRVRIPQVERRG